MDGWAGGGSAQGTRRPRHAQGHPGEEGGRGRLHPRRQLRQRGAEQLKVVVPKAVAVGGRGRTAPAVGGHSGPGGERVSPAAAPLLVDSGPLGRGLTDHAGKHVLDLWHVCHDVLD